MKVLSVFLPSLVSATIAFADAPVPTDPFYSDAGGYTGDRTLVSLFSSSGSKTNPDYGCTNAYCWGGVSLTDGYDCLVTNKTMYPMNIELTEGRPFPGHSLQFGIPDTYSKAAARGNLYMYCRYPQNPFIVNGDLIFVNGNVMMRYVSDSYIRAEKVSVWTPAGSPLQIYPNNVVEGDRGNTCSLQFDAPVAAPATAGMRIYQGKPGFDIVLGVKFAGDMSGYLGDISVETVEDPAAASGRTATTLEVCDTTIPGSVTMNTGTTLSSLNEGEPFGIGDLTLKAGSVLELSGDATVNNLILEGGAKIVVTKPLSAGVPKLTATGSASISGGTVEIVVSGYEAVADGLTAGLLVVPQDSAITEADFVITDASYDGLLVNAGRKALVPDETTETKSVAYVYDPIVSMTVSDNSNRSVEHSSALTNSADGVHSTQWSDELLPHAGVHYSLAGTGTKDAQMMILRSYDSEPVKSGNLPSLDYTFPGESLTLNTYSSLLLYGRTFTCNQVCVMGKSIQVCGSIYGPSTLDAPLYLAPNALMSSLLYFDSQFTFGGEISGSGAMSLTGHKGASTKQPGGTFYLSQLNTNFTGSITVTITVDFSEGAKAKGGYTPEFDPAGNRFATLYINDGRNLGGPTEPANPKAVTLQNMSRLAVADGATDVTIDEPTRGIFVNWCGRFYVPEADETLTIKSPLAVHGEVHKEGDGLLVLANPQPTFGTTATATTPDAESTNRMFVVDGGNVKVASAYALNGLDIVNVNDGSKFILDADTEDETLATYGLIDTLTPGTPFAVGGTATKVAFAVTVAEKPAWEEKEVALCTVKATDAEAVAAVISRGRIDNVGAVRIRSIEPVQTVLDNVECVTFKATVTGPQGLMMLFR